MKIILFVIAIFLNLGCSTLEKKITEISVKKVSLNIDTVMSVDCNSFDMRFKKIMKVYVIKNKIVLKNTYLIIKDLKYSDEIRNIDTRKKIIISYSDNTNDTICASLSGISLNGKLMDVDKKVLNFIHKL